MLKRLILTTAMSLTALSSAWAEDKLPVTGKTCSELLAFYKDLPFTSVLPLPDGPVSVPGKTGDITVGFSQTGFNHPWRTAMLAALQAELAAIRTSNSSSSMAMSTSPSRTMTCAIFLRAASTRFS